MAENNILSPDILPPYRPLYRKFESGYEERVKIWYMRGSYESGKSYAVAQYVLLHTIHMTQMGKPPRWLILRKMNTTNLTSTFALIRDLISKWGLGDKFFIVKTPMRITFSSEDHTGEIIFEGLQDPERIKSITGITNVWLEETKEMTEEDFLQARARLRGDGDREIILTFNPANKIHWLYQHFEVEDFYKDEICKIVTTYRDNPYLSEDRVRYYEVLKQVNYNQWLIASQGEWVNLSETVFTNITVTECPKDYDWYDGISLGLDFGYHAYSIVLLLGIKDESIYVIEEWARRKYTTSQIIEEIIPWLYARDLLRIQSFGDNADPGRLKELKTAGMTFLEGADRSKNDVLNGTNWLKSRPQIYIDPQCEVAKQQLLSFSYIRGKSGEILEQVSDTDADAFDALRYGTQRWRKARMKSKLFQVPSFI